MRRKAALMMSFLFGVWLAFSSALPSQATAGSQNKNSKGRQLYATYCASCHGVDGRGSGPAAAALKTRVPDLTRIAKQDGKFPALRVQRIISGDDVITEHGSREMPVWGRQFREKRDDIASKINIYALTKYIESIQAN
jgi:mono/diheme cytochrome c family protein